jgi:Zn-dependent alcohol dehydrogenase
VRIALALERLARAPELERLVTHRLPLSEANTAIDLVEGRHALKVLLGPAIT